MRSRVLQTSLLAGALFASAASAQTLDDLSMYGINRTTGELNRYDFGDQQFQAVGVIHQSDDAALLGIDASAYVPGFQNIFVFWTDPSDGLARLVYVDCETAVATPVGQDLGSGAITGAVAILTDGSESWLPTEAAQAAISGSININPNNSPDNEFTLICSDGQIITRDDLHNNAVIDAQGNFYVGEATNIRIKPKGNGNQNGIVHDGVVYPLSNGQTYLISGLMNVRVYNDHVVGNGKAMGHWWVEIIDGDASIDDGGDDADCNVELAGEWLVLALQTVDSAGSRLLLVDHQTGSYQQLMTLNNVYDALAWSDGKMLYATMNNALYRIDPATATETLVGTMPFGDVFGLEFAGESLMGFEIINDTLEPINHNDASSGGASSLVGMYDLGTIVFVPNNMDSANLPNAYD